MEKEFGETASLALTLPTQPNQAGISYDYYIMVSPRCAGGLDGAMGISR